MKKIVAIIGFVVMVCATTLWAEEYVFADDVEQAVTSYEGTSDPILPDNKAISEFEDSMSFPPGRLPMPVNIIINKRATRLYLVNVFGDTLRSFPVCCARNRGQKHSSGDCRTPEGNFTIVGIYNSTDWRYKGTGAKCYGPFFISIHTPGYYGVGIHGTNAPGSVPGRHSHGCIRMHNEDIRTVRSMVTKDSRVIILPDDPRAEAAEIAKIRADYVAPGTTTDRRVTDEEVEQYRRDHPEPSDSI